MLRSALGKAMWVGRTTAAVIGLAVALAVVFGVATMALAAVPGDPFKLGKLNTLNAMTRLAGTNSNVLLKITNGGSGSALGLEVKQGVPPMRVNSDKKVPNLNADKLDDREAADLLGKTEKAADSDRLDGIDSTSFVRGNANVYQGTVDLARGSGFSNLIVDTSNPVIGLQYFCPSDLSTLGTVVVLNRTFVEGAQTANLFTDNGSTNPTYVALPSGRVANEAASPNGEHVTFRVQVPGPKVVTMEVFSVHRPASNDCHVEAQAIVTR